ncbi:MAG: hypothetical protein ACFFG0_01590 [Candidatus Thorarchaeota archaeon]
MKLDPITEFIIFKQDLKENLSEFSLPEMGSIDMSSPAATVAMVGLYAASLIYIIIKLEKEAAKTPRCKYITTQPEYDICRYEEYIKIYRKEIALAKSRISSCVKDKKPEKCKKALNKIIKRAEKEIVSRETKLKKWYEKKKAKDIKSKR